MITTTRIAKSLLLSAGIASALMSCSKQEEVQPTAAATVAATSAEIPFKLVNGRVVFANLDALNQTEEMLNKLSTSQAGIQALADWEKNLHFTSLRTAANLENSHLEALEDKGIPTPAHDLTDKFGFPVAYATLINPAGEYQIADKIYWFHEGVKYQAESEAELAAIKKDPATAKVKLPAGYSLLKSSKGRLTGDANRTIAYDNPPTDDKYTYEFYLNGDPGSRRRTIYAFTVFTDYRAAIAVS